MAELTQAQEDTVAVAMQQAYDTWLPVVQRTVLLSYNRYGMMPDPAAINSTAALWRSEIEQVENQQLAPIAAENYKSEAVEDTFTVGDAIMVGAAAATLVYLMGQIGEIQSTLVNLTLGVTAVVAAASITQFLDPQNPHWAAKSRQVAATEGDRWAQAGTLSGALSAQRRDGIRRQKIWQTRRDNLVRDAHEHAQGQRKDLTEPFIVGGFPMMYPMDPAAPPSLVVNCRCWLRIVKRGA